MGHSWQGIIAIVICEPGNTRWGEGRGGERVWYAHIVTWMHR